MNLNFSAIKESKNLLAFSAGIDSSALFFLLLKENISFDIAIVDYNLRAQSKDEIKYAKDLASKYNKQVFIKEVNTPTSNFEKNARDIRYDFFENLIDIHSYDVLITAHQLNDKLEWFMMQLSKGAGILELIGFNELEYKNNYTIYKPLLDVSKNELEEFLKNEEIKYFYDESNNDEKYKRNYFRHNFCDKFLEEYKDGIKNSFEFLQKDIQSLNINTKAVININDLEIFNKLEDDNLNIRIIDLSLKKRGILLSKAQRDEIIKEKMLVVSHKIAISITNTQIWISPISKVSMDKKFKEICRVKKVPKNIRAYIFEKRIDIKNLMV